MCGKNMTVDITLEEKVKYVNLLKEINNKNK